MIRIRYEHICDFCGKRAAPDVDYECTTAPLYTGVSHGQYPQPDVLPKVGYRDSCYECLRKAEDCLSGTS